MGVSQEDRRIEGWLYLIRSNRIGLHYSRKRYFILQDQCLMSLKSMPTSNNEDPVKRATIDPCIRVTDNGRERINRKVFFAFSLYNTSNHNDRLKLGATSSEEAARWIRLLKEAALQECTNAGENVLACLKRKCKTDRSNGSKRTDCRNSIDWTLRSSLYSEAMMHDVIAPSPWTIFCCENGLRLFKEAKDKDFHQPSWDDHPATMAVGVIDGASEAIFRTVMSLGHSRSEWDFCIYRGSVIEHLDGHSDIIHVQLKGDWMPWGMRRRDLLLRRYWRREDDGTYVILYHSVYHKRCQPLKGYVRACLKSGGYVISPVNQGKQSVVKHMLAIDWKFWKSYLRTSFARSITIRMLGRLAALREFSGARIGNYPSFDLSSGQMIRDIGLPQNEREDIEVDFQNPAESGTSNEDYAVEEELKNPPSKSASLMELNETADEFFDIPEPSDNDESESLWPSDSSPEMHQQELCNPKLSTATGFVRKFHDLAIQKRGYVDLQDLARGEGSRCYGATLPKDPSCTMPCSWTTPDPSTFLIRGKSYLRDQQKIKAKGTLMQMVAADWLRSDKREDDLGGRPGGIVQKYAMKGGPEFFFIVNIQVPGSTTYNLALYYMMSTPMEESPLLESFIKGDDSYRNSRFKLIPYISKDKQCLQEQQRVCSLQLQRVLTAN
ncbi:protein ENHANCED DISEASE RESISTANCE 2-like isoform X2 [Telopea speciosissima]|uniref:protein ENHANCED DISEASE RESISTANCE 2-like isoform X2 n=1 Tax=Telopea speciosissima TaxID=54955 RepID=UPI001CC509D6|nr:protein ENHANCED DISEASE RESISTANCE 2-like isoform X2 [Telopea speciosissima]